MADLTGMLQAAAGNVGGGTGRYIAVGLTASPYFALLDHTSPGSLSLATTYSLSNQAGRGVTFSPDGAYIAVTRASGVTLLNHSSGSVSLATTYSLSGTAYTPSFTPDGNYLAVAHSASPYFTLLNHTTPGTLSLAATYTVAGPAYGCNVSPTGDYIAVANGTNAPYFTLLDHTTPGSVSLAATYTLSSSGYSTVFSPSGEYIAVGSVNSPFFTLLNHTVPGTVSLATTYVLRGAVDPGATMAFSPDGNYISTAHYGDAGSPPFYTLLDHTTPGTVTLAATYAIANAGQGTAFSPDGKYIGIAHYFGPRFTLLNHSAGAVSLASSYTFTANPAFCCAFSPN